MGSRFAAGDGLAEGVEGEDVDDEAMTAIVAFAGFALTGANVKSPPRTRIIMKTGPEFRHSILIPLADCAYRKSRDAQLASHRESTRVVESES
jgi:hypothetical protein